MAKPLVPVDTKGHLTGAISNNEDRGPEGEETGIRCSNNSSRAIKSLIDSDSHSIPLFVKNWKNTKGGVTNQVSEVNQTQRKACIQANT